ncbi:MAG: phage antirepressor KilAC domain-containing protein [Candidatus Peribacteria bacterium]|nr:phage antirepressor KilAC domain-containing protein [Candidatus Peribacteria bacterium]
MFDILRKHKIFYYDENKDNIPYEKFINEGYFVVDISKKPDNRGNRHNVSKATVKGLKFILNVVVGAIEKV